MNYQNDFFYILLEGSYCNHFTVVLTCCHLHLSIVEKWKLTSKLWTIKLFFFFIDVLFCCFLFSFFLGGGWKWPLKIHVQHALFENDISKQFSKIIWPTMMYDVCQQKAFPITCLTYSTWELETEQEVKNLNPNTCIISLFFFFFTSCVHPAKFSRDPPFKNHFRALTVMRLNFLANI